MYTTFLSTVLIFPLDLQVLSTSKLLLLESVLGEMTLPSVKGLGTQLSSIRCAWFIQCYGSILSVLRGRKRVREGREREEKKNRKKKGKSRKREKELA